ncbi:MAG TPA: VWA domain-containing protein [Myxococcota bacterium]|jgi:Ca-activated chloride channel family protein|nr:VWA domain-containing protein [Myxococcota bacterium]
MSLLGALGAVAGELGMPEHRLLRPWALLLLLGAVLAAYVLFWLRRERVARLSHPRAGRAGALPRGWAARVGWLPAALRVAALALLAVALARPQTFRPDLVELEGIDIVVALDMSLSMKGMDLRPTRLEAAKTVLEDFIVRRPNDRIGLVLFGRDAFTRCPITLDHALLKDMVEELDFDIIDGHGTAIGDAIGVSLNRLRASDAKSKIIILLTDGDSNSGKVAPLESARFAETLGVKVYPILVGARDEVPVEVGKDLFGRPMTEMQRFPVNPKLLDDIASTTGTGTHFRATDEEALQGRLMQILDELDKSRRKDAANEFYADAFALFALPALGLLGLETGLRRTRLRRVP